MTIKRSVRMALLACSSLAALGLVCGRLAGRREDEDQDGQ